MNIDKSQIKTALETVADPITGNSLSASGRIKNLDIEQGVIRCTLHFTESLSGDIKSSLNFACQEAIHKIDPSLQVHMHLETQVRQGEPPRSVLPQVKNIIAVASG